MPERPLYVAFELMHTTTISEYCLAGLQWIPIDPPITLTPGRWLPIIENGRVVRFDPLPTEPQASDDSD